MTVALLIINKNSRSGDAALPQVLEGLTKAGITPLYRDCGGSEEVSALIEREGSSVDLVIIGGGDGTLNAAATGLMKTRRPLGILPLGTANDLARTLNIPTDLAKAIDIIAIGKIRSIDVGQVNDIPFFNVASIGLSVELSQKLTAGIKRRFGRLGYAMAAVRALSGARPFYARIKGDGRMTRSFTLQISVGNGRYYGGGNVIEKDATIVDGMLRLYSLQFVQAWRMIFLLRSFRLGEHGTFKEVLTLKGKEFEVRTRRPRSINADGEVVTRTPARFQVMPKSIDVFVP